MNNNSLNILGQLKLMETRGYSAYEVAQLNGYTGTEQEWLESLVGPQGPQGPEGKSAYQVAVDNGYPGTEQEWIDSFLTPDGYYNKDEVDEKFNDKVNFIFPKFIPDGWLGDANLIKYKEKSILIDTDGSFNWNNLVTYLSDNNVEHIDYLIISHYDSDHIGNVDNLISNNYVDTDTVVYLPIVPSQFASALTTEENIKELLSANNITYITPTEKQQITIGDNLKITFGNLNKSYMEENYTQYNATCMVCLIEHKNIKAFYSGDAFQQTFKYLYDIGFIESTIDLYKQAHHGIDTENDFLLLDRIMSPIYTVQSSGIKDFVKNNFYCEETAFLIAQGTLYYPCYMQKEYINFESNGSSINCLQGNTYSFSGKRLNINLYVDINASTTDIQDGTEEHPFSEIMQAIGYIKDFSSGDVTINIADGYYGKSHEASTTHPKNMILISTNNNVSITLKGNSNDRTKVILSRLQVYDSRVNLYDLTVDVDPAEGILLRHSQMFAENILITSHTLQQNNHTGIYVANGSNLTLRSSKVEYCNYGVRVLEGSYYSYDTVEFANYTQKPVQVTDSKTCYKNIKGNDSGLDTNLTDSYLNYDWLEIRYRSNDGIAGLIKITSPSDNLRIGVEIPYTNTNGVSYDKRCIFTLNNSNKISKSALYQITTGSDGTVSVSSLANNGIVIQQVWAGYNG